MQIITSPVKSTLSELHIKIEKLRPDYLVSYGFNTNGNELFTSFISDENRITILSVIILDSGIQCLQEKDVKRVELYISKLKEIINSLEG